MYEFYGWAALRESSKEIDEGNLKPLVNRIRGKAKNLSLGQAFWKSK